jgi:hypothetical protein
MIWGMAKLRPLPNPYATPVGQPKYVPDVAGWIAWGYLACFGAAVIAGLLAALGAVLPQDLLCGAATETTEAPLCSVSVPLLGVLIGAILGIVAMVAIFARLKYLTFWFLLGFAGVFFALMAWQFAAFSAWFLLGYLLLPAAAALISLPWTKQRPWWQVAGMAVLAVAGVVAFGVIGFG